VRARGDATLLQQTQLTRVERLDLSHNLITRIENTEHCYRLAYLNLGSNLITSVADINLVLGNVTVLVLRDNALASLLGVQKLFNLRRLDLAGNALTDVGEVRELGTLPALEQLALARNPLATAPTYRIAVLGGACACAYMCTPRV
jgi:Leucine-rich repeat (LRR) protein